MTTLSVHVKTLLGKVHTVTVSPDMTILEGKSQIPNTNVLLQRWAWKGRNLVDDETFCKAGVKHDDIIHLVIKANGGALNFSSMDDKIRIKTKKVEEDSPKYLIVGTGLNIRCVCDWDKCPTQKYGGNVYIPKGLGTHDVTKLEARCPECTQPVRMVTPCFYDCSYRIDGVLTEGKKKIYFEGSVIEDRAEEYNDNKTAEWESLIIRCFGQVIPHVKE